MRYLYQCVDGCKKQTVINKPMRNASNPERCPNCEKIMKRVYEPMTIKTGDGTKS